MTALIIALAPFITSAITGFVKNLKPFAALTTSRNAAVRLLAAGISIVYILAGLWITGSFDANSLASSVQLFDFSLLSWLGSLGVFHAFFASPAVDAVAGVIAKVVPASPRVVVAPQNSTSTTA